jgi:hypothetical protein
MRVEEKPRPELDQHNAQGGVTEPPPAERATAQRQNASYRTRAAGRRFTHIGSLDEPLQHVGHRLAVHPRIWKPLLGDFHPAVFALSLLRFPFALPRSTRCPARAGEEFQAMHGRRSFQGQGRNGRDEDSLDVMRRSRVGQVDGGCDA